MGPGWALLVLGCGSKRRFSHCLRGTSFPNRGETIPTANAPAPDLRGPSGPFKPIAPWQHTEAHMAMLNGIQRMDDNCVKIFTRTTDVARGRAMLGNIANTITFHEGTESKNMNLTGWNYNLSFADYHAL